MSSPAGRFVNAGGLFPGPAGELPPADSFTGAYMWPFDANTKSYGLRRPTAYVVTGAPAANGS